MDTFGYSGPFYARTNRQMCRGGLRKVRQSSSFEQLEPRCILFCDVREARCRRLLAGCGFKGATDIDWCLERHRVAQVCVGNGRQVCGGHAAAVMLHRGCRGETALRGQRLYVARLLGSVPGRCCAVSQSMIAAERGQRDQSFAPAGKAARRHPEQDDHLGLLLQLGQRACVPAPCVCLGSV